MRRPMVITMYIKRNELVVVAFECCKSIRINASVPKLSHKLWLV